MPLAVKKRPRRAALPQSTSDLLVAPLLLKTFVLAVVAIAGCVWAILRARNPPPRASPAPAPTEIPAPELEAR